MGGLAFCQISKGSVPIRPQRLQLRPMPGGDLCQRRRLVRRGQDQRRARVLDEVINLGRHICGVKGQEHDPRLNAGRIDGERIDTLVNLGRKPVAWLHTQTCQGMGKGGGARQKSSVGEGRAIVCVYKWCPATGLATEQAIVKRIGHRPARPLFLSITLEPARQRWRNRPGHGSRRGQWRSRSRCSSPSTGR